MISLAQAASLILAAPRDTWTIQYGTGEPCDPWTELSTPFRSLRAALAWFGHLTRSNPVDAYRVVDGTGRMVIMVVPGTGGAA